MYVPDLLSDGETIERVISVEVAPSSRKPAEALAIKSLSLVKFKQFSLLLQINFANPNAISDSIRSMDTLRITFMQEKFFVDDIDRLSIDVGLPLEALIPQ